MIYFSIVSNVGVVNNTGINNRKKEKENIRSEDACSVWDKKPELAVLIERLTRDSLTHVFPAHCVSLRIQPPLIRSRYYVRNAT